MLRLSEEGKRRIVALRKQGKSIPEISEELGFAKTTVQRYVLGVSIPKEFLKRLKEKQGGSKERAAGLRANVLEEVITELGELSDRDLLFLLIGLYWGEGTKRDFGIINSDPFLIQTFIKCLQSLGIEKTRISLAVRVHRDVSIPPAKKYWSTITGLAESAITRIEVIEGKKKGKLPYGMCRVRVRSGIRERLFIQSAIQLIGKESDKTLLSP